MNRALLMLKIWTGSVMRGWHGDFGICWDAWDVHFKGWYLGFPAKSLQNANENFRIFSRNVSFAGTLIITHTTFTDLPLI